VDKIPPAFVAKEVEIESGKDDLGSKPEAVRAKIVQGRIEKRLKEMCLLDQVYIKDQTKTVDELVKETASKLSENIKVNRFVRFVVGEGQDDATAETSHETPSESSTEPLTEKVPVSADDMEAAPKAQVNSLGADVLSQFEKEIAAIETAIASLKSSLKSAMSTPVAEEKATEEPSNSKNKSKKK
jgi:Elongation factor TS